MTRVFLTFMFLVGLTSAAMAVTLDEVVSATLEHHPDIAISEAVVSERAGDRLGAISSFLPTVTARLSEIESETDNATVTTTSTELTGSVNLFNGFSDTNAVRSANSSLYAARISRSATRQALIRAAADLYADIRRRQAVAERYELMRDNAVILYDIAEAKFSAGRLRRTELLKAEADMQEREYRLIDAEREVATALVRLSSYAGIRYAADEPFDDHIPVFIEDDVENLLVLARQNNPDLVRLAAEAAAARAASAGRWGGFLPRVDANATKGTYETDDLGEYDETRVSLTMSWELFSGMGDTGRLIAARSAARRAELNRIKRLNEITEDITTTHGSIISNRKRLGFLERLVDVARESHDRTLASFRLGKSDITDVIIAEDDLIEAVIEYEATRYALVSDTLRLRYLVGKEVL